MAADTGDAFASHGILTSRKRNANSCQTNLVSFGRGHSVTILVGVVAGIIIADRRMWLQYVADVGTAPEQIEAASIRASMRRMSRALVVQGNENSQGAAVFPEEKEGSAAETSGSQEANDDDMGDEIGSENNKGSFATALGNLGNTLVLIMIVIGYPVAVLPYYRASSTTE